MGFQLLNNEHVIINKEEQNIRLVGCRKLEYI